MPEPTEERATEEEMQRVRRCWGLPTIQLGPGAVAHLYGSSNMTVSFIIGTALRLQSTQPRARGDSHRTRRRTR